MASKKVIKTTTTVTEEIIENVNETTEILCVLDTSGSMGTIIDDARGGFNNFIKEQKKLSDKARLTVVLFDDKYEILYNSIDFKEVHEIRKDQWQPRGTTALYDAIGKTINTYKQKYDNLKAKDRPEKVLFAIVTDGQENASREYGHDVIKKLISDCKERGWVFMFLAADQDAFGVGTSMGMSGGNTFTYTNTAQGNTMMFASLSNATASYRNVSVTSANYSAVADNLLANADNKKDTPLNGTITTDNTIASANSSSVTTDSKTLINTAN